MPAAARTPAQLRLAAQAERERRRRARQRAAAADADPIRWITQQFYIPELDGPIQLYPYQVAALREALRRDDAGNFVYDTVVWGDIKKSAKSSVAAAVALWRASVTPWATVRIVANDLKQADSREAYYIRRAIALNSRLPAHIANYRVNLPNHSRIEAVAMDPQGEAGGGDDMVLWTELWAMHTKAAKLMWTEMTLSPLKFGKSQRWINTYAGYEGESPLLQPLYDAGTGGQRLDLSYDGYDLRDVPAYAHGRLFLLWNDRPRLPWQSADYYDSERATLLPAEFDRIHRNVWAAPSGRFIPMAWWEACRQAAVPAAAQRARAVLALDAAISGDTFALVVTSRYGGLVWPLATRVWKAAQGEQIDYAEVEREVLRLCRQYRVWEIRYDPYQLHDMAQRLRQRRLRVEEFSQQGLRLVADKQLYDKIRDGGLAQAEPDDSPLTAHIANANARLEQGKMRLVKRSDGLPIDAAVALSMSAYEPEQPTPPPGVVAQGRARRKPPR